MGENKRISFIIGSVYFFIIAIFIYFFIKYMLGPLSPFITAFIIVTMSRKIIISLEKHSHSKKYSSALFTLLLIAVLSFSVYGVFLGFFKELSKLSGVINEEYFEELLVRIEDFLSSFRARFPSNGFFTKLFDYTLKELKNFDKSVLPFLTSTLPSLLSYSMKFLSFFPEAVIFLGFMFIGMFYISHDYDKICSFLMLQLPKRTLDTLDETKDIITSTAKELFKSYFLLTLITFFQLLLGFMIMGIEYSLLLATLISFVDLLPILGTGTILIPWSLICFFTNNVPIATGLIVLYSVITLFRRIAEPKIIGNNLGLHPLLSLISIFLGIKLIGFSGIIIFPILTTTIISLNRKGFIKLYRNFPENSTDKILKTRRKFLDFKKNDSLSCNSSGGDTHDDDNN